MKVIHFWFLASTGMRISRERLQALQQKLMSGIE